jgi:hypothetical protein
MPVMILSEHKASYLDALEDADRGRYQSFVDFMLLRSFDTITLVAESLRNAQIPSVKESLAAINGPFLAKGEFSEQQIDEAGARLLKTFGLEAQKEVSKVTGQKIQGTARVEVGVGQGYSPTHKPAKNGGQNLHLEIISIQPSRVPTVSLPPVVAKRQYDLLVPRDAGGQDEFQLKLRNGNDLFTARVDEVLPAISGVLQMRAGMFAERVVAEMLAELKLEVDRVNHARH